MNDTITRERLAVAQRSHHVEQLFGIHFPLQLEPTIFSFAAQLSPDYHGGYWEFHALGNGGFYLAPDSDEPFAICCPNGYSGQLSPDAFGITVCLYAYSHLSFSAAGRIAQVYAEHYHLLRDYAMEHPEVRAILAATD